MESVQRPTENAAFERIESADRIRWYLGQEARIRPFEYEIWRKEKIDPASVKVSAETLHLPISYVERRLHLISLQLRLVELMNG